MLDLLGGRGGEGGGDGALFDVPACRIRLYLAYRNDSGNNVPHRRSKGRENGERKGRGSKTRQDKTKLHWTGLNRERASEPEQSWESLTKSRENNNKKKEE